MMSSENGLLKVGPFSEQLPEQVIEAMTGSYIGLAIFFRQIQITTYMYYSTVDIEKTWRNTSLPQVRG